MIWLISYFPVYLHALIYTVSFFNPDSHLASPCLHHYSKTLRTCIPQPSTQQISSSLSFLIFLPVRSTLLCPLCVPWGWPCGAPPWWWRSPLHRPPPRPPRVPGPAERVCRWARDRTEPLAMWRTFWQLITRKASSTKLKSSSVHQGPHRPLWFPANQSRTAPDNARLHTASPFHGLLYTHAARLSAEGEGNSCSARPLVPLVLCPLVHIRPPLFLIPWLSHCPVRSNHSMTNLTLGGSYSTSLSLFLTMWPLGLNTSCCSVGLCMLE